MPRPVEPCSLETCIRTLEERGFIGIEERYRLLTELSQLRDGSAKAKDLENECEGLRRKLHQRKGAS